MSTTQNLKKMAAAALLSGGVALAGLGLASATAHATPFNYGALPEPMGPHWVHQGWTPFGYGPLPQPIGPHWSADGGAGSSGANSPAGTPGGTQTPTPFDVASGIVQGASDFASGLPAHKGGLRQGG